jgi:hypothetical protein
MQRTRTPELRAYYRLILSDKNGKVIKKGRWRKSHSFVIQFLQLLRCNTYPSRTLDIKDITGATRTSGTSGGGDLFNCEAPAGTTTRGIVVGTGVGAESNTDNKLGTQISHGTGAGALQYGAQTFADPAVVGANVDFVLTRIFSGNLSGSVTVNEIGIYTYCWTSSYQMCIIRDLLGAGEAVGVGQNLTVQYTLRTTA